MENKSQITLIKIIRKLEIYHMSHFYAKIEKWSQSVIDYIYKTIESIVLNFGTVIFS